MKKFFASLYLCLCFLTPAIAQQQWKWLNPQPSGAAGLKIVFVNAQTGFILNNEGQLLKTVDQGAHWQIAGAFGQMSCMDIVDSTGVMAGYGGLYISSDDGNSWMQQNSGISDNFTSISIVSRDTFFLSATNGVMYSTADRGKTLTKLSIGGNYNNYSINCMSFLDSKLGFVGSSESTIFKTQDGGQTWQLLLSSNLVPSGILAFQFLNKDTGYASQEYDNILVTHDGGATWSTANSSQPTNTIAAPSALVAYAAGGDGFITKTVDGGVTWNSVTPPNEFKDGYDLNSICFLSDNTGFAVGLLGRILETTDGGASWNTYSPTYIPVTAVSFPSADTGYITTWNNVYKSTDSGVTWAMLPLTVGTAYASSSRFEQAQFSSADTGFLVSSSSATVFNTADGGVTWTQQNPAPYSYDIVPGVDFLDKKTGYMALEETSACCSGMIVKTKDGGQSWSTVWGSQYNGQVFDKIFFADDSTVFGIQSYQLYKSADSAKTWTLLNVPNQYPTTLSDLCFTDKKTGFVASEGGTIFITYDGGTTWQYNNALANYVGDVDINAIKFFNPQVGYFTGGNDLGPGNYGFIFKTIDSGRTWQQSFNHGGTAISFTPDSSVLVANFGGMLVKSRVANWQIDSVLASYVNYPCTQQLSASAGVAFGRADSLSFEVTSPNNTIEYLNANPDSVINGRVICTAPSDPSWVAGAIYTVRFRLFYKGEWQYSAPISITAAGVPQPVITNSGGVLFSSSSSGNQWYLNGVAIPGATDNGWSPLDTGYYSVLVTQIGCSSLMSDSTHVAGIWNAASPVVSDTGCTEKFSATLQTALTPADSVSFEITATVLTITDLPASPNEVINSTVAETASTDSLAPGQSYSVRLKFWINGAYQYSNSVNFTLPVPVVPVITDSAGQLFSSYPSGNQWYLNGTSIPGANASYFVPQQSGSYSVQSSAGACATPMSQPTKVVVSNQGAGVVAGNLGVVAYPNPVSDHLTLLNTQNRDLLVTVVSFNGNTVYSGQFATHSMTIPTAQLAPGQYVVYLVDAVTKERTSFSFAKL